VAFARPRYLPHVRTAPRSGGALSTGRRGCGVSALGRFGNQPSGCRSPARHPVMAGASTAGARHPTRALPIEDEWHAVHPSGWPCI
jgi:hypothetical protein